MYVPAVNLTVCVSEVPRFPFDTTRFEGPFKTTTAGTPSGVVTETVIHAAVGVAETPKTVDAGSMPPKRAADAIAHHKRRNDIATPNSGGTVSARDDNGSGH